MSEYVQVKIEEMVTKEDRANRLKQIAGDLEFVEGGTESAYVKGIINSAVLIVEYAAKWMLEAEDD